MSGNELMSVDEAGPATQMIRKFVRMALYCNDRLTEEVRVTDSYNEMHVCDGEGRN